MVVICAFYVLDLDFATALGVVELLAAVTLVGTGSLFGGLYLDGRPTCCLLMYASKPTGNVLLLEQFYF